MARPFDVVADFEEALCKYTGSDYAVTTTSCTMALLLACACAKVGEVTLPKRTYLSVPMSVIHAGGTVRFKDIEWSGEYQLWPYKIWDSARRFTSNMYKPGHMQCLSFHWNKILGIQQGGAILTNNWHRYNWMKRARFDGRREGVHPKHDNPILGYHCYMSPETAAAGLVRLHHLPEYNEDLPNDDYPDLSEMECFKCAS